MKDANITSNITKTGTELITSKYDTITYNIDYTVSVDTYVGSGVIKIVDQLPFAIDLSNSELDGGNYNSYYRTITWTENVDIDTLTDGTYTYNFDKTITVAISQDSNYNDFNDSSFTNSVIGSIELNATGQTDETDPATAITNIEFQKIDLTVTKNWVVPDSSYTIPDSVIIQVKDGDTVLSEQTISSENATDTYTWEYTFRDVPRYDDNGDEITYTINEVEVTEGDLDNFDFSQGSYSVDNSSLNAYVTVTNSYVGPIISQTKSYTTEKGLAYVVEGETITYTITITNDGERGKDVIVKDTIPEGTTFVDGSIKVDNEETDYTSGDLNSGITVNVGAESETTVSFEVTVDELENGIYSKELRNTAVVDGENTNTTVTTVNKSNLTFEKSSDPDNGSLVTYGDEITYEITLSNTGSLATNAVVKDSAPEGTTFVEGSIKVNNQETAYTSGDLNNGITVNVGADSETTVSFTVTVNALNEGEYIRNAATVNDISTNETTHEYALANIEATKQVYAENNLDYIVPGEKLTYIIYVKNSGGLSKDVVIKDTVPTGTTFVDGSIKVNSQSNYNGTDLTQLTANDLNNGITVNTPAASVLGEGFVRLSFEVTVNEDATGEIRNVGTVDEVPTNEVTKPVLTTEKVSSVIRHDETSDLAENEVTVNDEIRYTIRVTNTGTTTVNEIEVKDSIPEGTKLISIDNGGVQEDEEIVWNLSEINGGETREVSFTVKVEYAKENYSIINTALVDDNPTNEVENPYVKLTPEVESTLEKNGTDIITNKNQVVNYEVKFTASVDDFKGTAKVTLVDTLPYGIDISNSKLANGKYNPDNKTITWEEEINVDTFATNEVKEIVITKSIEIVYVFEDINATTGSMINRVNSNIELIKDGDTVTSDEKQAEKETTISIPTEVIVHHYIYDADTDTYTTVKLAPDEIIDGIVGQEYNTTPSSEVPSNYTCIDIEPENYTGRMTEETIEVNYYYSLITPTLTNTIDKTAIANTVEEREVEGSTTVIPVITNEGEQITYTVKYTATIDNYLGTATVAIVDTLPAEIDLESSDLGNGRYDSTYHTITWEESIEDVNTFANGTYNYEFERTIKLVYKEQNKVEDLSNTVAGTVNLYYPDDHSTNPGKVQVTESATDTAIVAQDYKVDLIAEKVWDDDNNIRENRPESVVVTFNGGSVDGTTVELNDSNDWVYYVNDLDKYDENGNEISYSVSESEKNTGDLTYYNTEITELNSNSETVNLYRITNEYKLTEADLDSEITKTGPEEIRSSSETVSYDINFTSTIKDYIGDGKVIITDTLPYRIDVDNSNLDGGTYDEEAQTITWEEDITAINTFVNGDYNIDITKNIAVVFTDLDASGSSFTNNVEGKVRLYATEQEDEATASTTTVINIFGNVIVRYIDIDTGEEIAERVQITEKVGEEYTTNRKIIEGYDYLRSTINTEGVIIEGTQEVTYYYERTKAQVIVKYQDKDGNSLTEDIVIDGKVGDEYTTEQKEFENYKFVSVTENAEGTITEETITVIYVYEKTTGKVIVQYLEKDTNKVLALEEEITGNIGDEYYTDRKIINNYQSAEPEPDNKTGVITEETIIVIYYYEKISSGDVIVKYVDIDTDEEITYIGENGEETTYGYTITGNVGDNYETEQKEIPYYKFIESTPNTTGQLTEAGDTVIYYYQKQGFNLGVTKTISEITVNGGNQGVGDGKSSKVEVYRKDINTADVQVKYKITVNNTGELEGRAKVVDVIPAGYTVSSNNPTYWTNSNGTLETEVELQPGETRELEVVLKWVNGETNFGTSENIARITDLENPANYAETTTEDNEDSASLVTSVETGINRNVYLIITTYLLMIGLVVLLYLYQQYQKERKGEIASRKTLKLKLPNDKK